MREYLVKIKTSQLFFRTHYRRFAIVSIFQMLFSVLLIAAAAYQIETIPNPPYFASTADGRIINLDPKIEGNPYKFNESIS